MAKSLQKVNLLDFTCDPNLCNRPVSEAQEVLIRAIDGLPLRDKRQEDIYRECTGRSRYVKRCRDNVVIVAGVRGGKDSVIMVPRLILSAVTGDHQSYLAAGELAWHVVVAQGFRGAVDVSFGYLAGVFDSSPMLGSMVVDRKQYEIHLRNRAVITAFPCTRTAPLGYTISAAMLSEVAHFKNDTGQNIDRQVIAGVRRGQGTVPDDIRIFMMGSSPRGKIGEIWRAYQTGFGVEDAPYFVWHATSQMMNPTIDQAFLAAEKLRDPELFRQNYLAEFLDSISGFLSDEVITGSMVAGRRENPPLPGEHYVFFNDPAGGTIGGDPFAVAGGHVEPSGRFLIDCVRVWSPPFNPKDIVAEAAALLKLYGCRTVTGDRFSGGFVRDEFRLHGIEYIPSEMDKSTLYHELLPRMNAGQVELLDLPQLLRELRGLERRRGGGSGKDRVDHAPGQHDDMANCVAGVVALLAQMPRGPVVPPAGVGRRLAALGAEGDLHELVDWTERGSRGVPDRWGDW